MSATLDPSTSQLVLGEDGIWHAREHDSISYPEAGNDLCFELEEGSFWFAHRAACIVAASRRLRPAGAIYDIGGGNGFVTRAMLDAGFDAVLVEPGEAGARNAIRRGLPTVVCASLATAGFAAGSLPAVGIFDVLEHIGDDAAFLAEIHRALTPGGRFYITVPAFSWLWSDDDIAAGHFRRYTLTSLMQRVNAAGFAPLYDTFLFSPLPLPLFVARSIPSLFGHCGLPRQKYGRLHKQRARWITDRVWAAELRRVASGRRIPFGSSCLLVAEKR